jgi:L-lactate dehydrogenase (cytochrome)
MTFRKLAKKRLPSPIFHYIDGGADDEATLKETLMLLTIVT